MKLRKIIGRVIIYTGCIILISIFLYSIIKNNLEDIKGQNFKILILATITYCGLFLIQRLINRIYILYEYFAVPSLMVIRVLKLSSKIGIMLFFINIFVVFIFLSLTYFILKMNMENLISYILNFGIFIIVAMYIFDSLFYFIRITKLFIAKRIKYSRKNGT